MKSPQFSTWSPAGDVTKGGSVIGSFPTGEALGSLSFHRSSDVLVNDRDGLARVDRGRLAGAAAVGLGGEGVEVGAAHEGAGEDEMLVPVVPGWKRLLDFSGILLSLPISLPLGLFIMGWIKVVSPGPVFFRQARIGRGGRVFNILKFRSMKVDAPTSTHEQHLEQLIKSDAPMTKLDGQADPRIIAGGRCLRAMGLDELPQLINVLRGEMSLVGPRPSTPNEFALYTEAQRSRATVLPGLTGYWQVSGKNKLTFQQMIHLDLQYIEKMCVGMDLAIVVATLPAMFLQFIESRQSRTATNPPGDTAVSSSAGQAATRPC